MLYKVSSISSLLLLLALSSCQKAESMHKISQITYVSESGTILPELQWHEEFIIQQNSITFTRTGNADSTDINAGSWSLPSDSTALAVLFETLENIDLSKIERIEPVDQPDGGGSLFYQFTFSDGKTWSLDYTNGVTYTNGEWITLPVEDFINTLQLPLEAANRYKT